MRHSAKAQKKKNNPVIWMMPVDKMDESLFSVYVVEAGSWYVLMRKMNKILRTQPLLRPLMVAVLTGEVAGGSPSQVSRRTEAMRGPRCPIILNTGFTRTSLAVLGLGLHASTVGSVASISGWGLGPHMACSAARKLKNFKK